ncbi:probable calcium-binding protein CML43 [Durio zibethinus]|uniref:Probable calcium-binding protein CML43 n=1 Tax=Durio zibethinus TaxID=66656 RepID=A0A6P5ZV56_DURZI|nr:probable calcium-binding protein CML43 [Durio zibethinus]
MGELLHTLGGEGVRSTSAHIDPIITAACKPQSQHHHRSAPPPVHDLMLRALTAVFGMDQTNCRINKEKARQVVEMLGLVDQAGEDMQDTNHFDLPGGGGLEEEIPLEEVLGVGGLMEDGSKRNEPQRQDFRNFDEDGNGFMDALELKRVLQCLGLDNGWDMAQIENMLKVVDLNLDGKVDFSELIIMA